MEPFTWQMAALYFGLLGLGLVSIVVEKVRAHYVGKRFEVQRLQPAPGGWSVHPTFKHAFSVASPMSRRPLPNRRSHEQHC